MKSSIRAKPAETAENEGAARIWCWKKSPALLRDTWWETSLGKAGFISWGLGVWKIAFGRFQQLEYFVLVIHKWHNMGKSKNFIIFPKGLGTTMKTLSTLKVYLSNWQGVGPKSRESLKITETEGSMEPKYLAEVIEHADHYLTRWLDPSARIIRRNTQLHWFLGVK